MAGEASSGTEKIGTGLAGMEWSGGASNGTGMAGWVGWDGDWLGTAG